MTKEQGTSDRVRQYLEGVADPDLAALLGAVEEEGKDDLFSGRLRLRWLKDSVVPLLGVEPPSGARQILVGAIKYVAIYKGYADQFPLVDNVYLGKGVDYDKVRTITEYRFTQERAGSATVVTFLDHLNPKGLAALGKPNEECLLTLELRIPKDWVMYQSVLVGALITAAMLFRAGHSLHIDGERGDHTTAVIDNLFRAARVEAGSVAAW